MSEGTPVTNRPMPPYGGGPIDPMTTRSDPGDFTTQRSDPLAWQYESPVPAEQPPQQFGADPYQQQYQQYAQPQYQYPQYAQPQAPPAPRKMPMGAVIAAAVIGVGLLGGGLAYSLTSSSEQQPATPAPVQQTVVPQLPAVGVAPSAPPPVVAPPPVFVP